MGYTTAKIRILDEVSMAVVGIHPDDNKYLYNHFARHAPGYFFNPSYKLGKWDGKIRFFKENGQTYLYLVEEIVDYLVRVGYEIEVEDARSPVPVLPLVTDSVFSHHCDPSSGNPIQLRDYQVDAINSLLETGYGVLKAATGAGKTYITAALAWQLGSIGVRTITIVPDGTLVKQTIESYAACGIDVGEYSGLVKDLDHIHIVSTWQALNNNPALMLLFDGIIVDECHGVKGPVLQEIVITRAAKIPFRFGVTGTLPPDPCDELTVLVALGPVRREITAKELIDAGVLASVRVEVVQLEEDFTAEYKTYCSEFRGEGPPHTYVQFKDKYFPEYAAERQYLQKNRLRAEAIARIIMARRDAHQGNVLCLVTSIPFARLIASFIPDCHVVNGQDTKSVKDRKAIYDLYKEGNDIVTIATAKIASTGLNIPRINSMVLVDLEKSFIRVIQSIGRSLRKAHDKDEAVIIDVASDLKYGKRHLAERLRMYDEASYPYTKTKVNYAKLMIEEEL